MKALESFSIRYIPPFVTVVIIIALVSVRRLVECIEYSIKVIACLCKGLFISYDNISLDMAFGSSFCYSIIT